jgi:hypothetical protein
MYAVFGRLMFRLVDVSDEGCYGEYRSFMKHFSATSICSVCCKLHKLPRSG